MILLLFWILKVSIVVLLLLAVRFSLIQSVVVLLQLNAINASIWPLRHSCLWLILLQRSGGAVQAGVGRSDSSNLVTLVA